MDAKPQRPRALRVHDENMPPPALPGKTLHQRTKSTPAFSTLLQAGAVKLAGGRKVLGEANANTRVIQPAKDDSVIDKKGSVVVELMKPAAALARPAARPSTAKSLSTQNVSLIASTAVTTNSSVQAHATEKRAAPVLEPVKTVVAKKSIKTLKGSAVVSVLPDTQTTKLAPPLLPQDIPASHLPITVDAQAVVCQVTAQQEARKTETVPLRDETRPSVPLQPVIVESRRLPPGFASEKEYVLHLEAQAQQLQSQIQYDQGFSVPSRYISSGQMPVQQYYEDDEEEYYYEDGYTTGRSFGLRGESTGGVTTVLAPKESEKARLELEAAKLFVESTRTQEDLDDEQWDSSMVAEYGDEIFQYMRDLENRMQPNPRYMDQQQEIQWSMRAVLVDWVVQVHARFNLLPETLFLTVNYIDRFLSCKIVSLGKLQLVGATALFVAAKYEEVNCPTINEIIYMVDGGYSADELLKAERFMLSMLQFELGWPGPMSFLRRISKADDYDLETRTLAKYFLEVTIMDERFVGCTPSFLAAGAHCMARLMLRKGNWSPAHVYYANYTYSQLRQLLNAMVECCEDPRKHHMAVYDKYVDKRYKRASTFVEAEMMKGFQLPQRASLRSSLGQADPVTGWLK